MSKYEKKSNETCKTYKRPMDPRTSSDTRGTTVTEADVTDVTVGLKTKLKLSNHCEKMDNGAISKKMCANRNETLF